MLNFDISPYYDDTSSTGGAIDNNYMRILFRPGGYAVQARELTALQSILQNQISTLGGFVFQNGSPVSGGHISLDTNVVAVQLQPQYANTDIDLTNFLVNGNATLIINASGATNVKAVVIATDTTQINPVLLLKYLTANEFQNGDVIQVATGLQSQAQLVTANSSTGGSVVSINEGVFYSGGFFVKVAPQTIVLDSTSTTPTYRIGLQISESIVDEITDTALLDPAQGSFNYQAPGATRYQYSLQLTKRSLNSIDDSAFYELLRVENGLITKQIDYPVFADLDKALAQRTYDTSGDFTVTPFVVTAQANSANTQQFNLVVEPGKAYVKGFEFETIGTQKLAIDKALSTNTVTDYGMSLDYGNYVIATNLASGNSSGIFDITQYQLVDLHAIVSGNINTTNVATYNSTVVGNARVRDIEFLGLGSYYVYLTEINVTSNSFTASAGSLNSVTLPATYSNIANAYANVTISVTTNGVTDTRTITNYSTGRVATLDRNLSVAATGSSTCTLVFGFKDVNSIVIEPSTFGGNVFATQNATSAVYACMDISVGGKDSNGGTVLSDTKFNKLIYPLPQNFVAQNTIINASFETRKNLWSQSFTSGNLTISSGSGLGSGESFPYGITGGYLPDVLANTNFLVVVKNSLSSNLANGQILNFNIGTVSGGNGVFQTDGTHLTIVSSANNTFIADVILTVEVTNASTAAVARRTKTLVGNSSNTVLLATDKYTNGTQVIGSSPANTVYIDTANGFVWFTSNAAMAMTPGASQSLYVPDVFNIIKIYDSGSPTIAPNIANALIDITNNYYLNSGQKDNYYDHAALILKPGANPPSGQTVVMCQYYQHDTIGSPVLGFFDADSYTANNYAQGLIPYYNSQSFGTLSLRDSIDFRPTRTIGMSANVNTLNLSGLMTPYPDAAMILTFGYYLPRVDKLMLSKDKVFRINPGVPAQYPVPPSDSDDAITLYIITVPAFTPDITQVKMQYIEHRRYTMQDIGALDTRIQSLELQSTLSALEQQATSEKILYQDGITNKDQYGIIADDFGNFSISDTNNYDLRCYMAQGSMTPYKHQENFALSLQSASGTYRQDGKCYTLDYTETAAVVQNTATTYISVQPYLFAQFKGTTKLTPQTVTTFSANLTPAVITPPAATTIVNLPVVPPPTPALAFYGSNTKSTTTVVSAKHDYNDVFDFWTYRYYTNSAVSVMRIPRRINGFGAISPYYNWYGVKKATTTTTNAATNSVIPSVASSVQLTSSTARAPSISSLIDRGRIPLFGSR